MGTTRASVETNDLIGPTNFLAHMYSDISSCWTIGRNFS